MSAQDDGQPEAQEPPRTENGGGKRKAEAESPLESELPPPKRNNSCSVAADEHDPPPQGPSTDDAEPEAEAAPPPGSEDPPADAPPPAHDPAYAAAAFPEPVALPVQAAPAVTGTVGYSMPAYDGVSHTYSFPVDHLLVGRVIGKGGDTIRQIQFASGAHIDINQQVPEGAPRTVRAVGPARTTTLGSGLHQRRPSLVRLFSHPGIPTGVAEWPARRYPGLPVPARRPAAHACGVHPWRAGGAPWRHGAHGAVQQAVCGAHHWAAG